MKIFITGASGFIGANLTGYLKAHYPEATLVSIGRAGADLGWNTLTQDDFKSADAIIHLAGKAHDTRNTSAADEYFQVNYELTKRLYDHYLKSNARTFIYVSSVKAAADTVDGVLMEDIIPDPQTPYGQSKLKAEQYISEHTKEGGRYYILRPCMVHGPGNKGNLNLLYQFVNKGMPYPLAAYANRRSFLSVDNFSYIVHRLLTGSVASGAYNLADDESLDTVSLIRLIAGATGKRARIWSLPPWLVNGIARAGDAMKLPLNSERLKKLTESYEVSNDKIKKALGITGLPVAAREGLIRTFDSFK